MVSQEEWDVVVVGAGSAGFAAAVAARQGGAERVLMVEKAPETEAGGNARFSLAGFRQTCGGLEELRKFLPHFPESKLRCMNVPIYTADDFIADLNRVTLGRIDQKLARVLAEESGKAMHWINSLGMKWDIGDHVVVDGQMHFEPGVMLHPDGGGRAQLATWKKIATDLGIVIRYDTALAAIHGTLRGVTGLRVTTEEGMNDILATATILCAGGFQANREMRARYLSAHSDFMKVRGSRHNTGEALRMALDLGARAAGHWQGAHCSTIDAGAPDFEVPVRSDGRGSWTNRYDYPIGITVNQLGLRFFDEGEAYMSDTYAKAGRVVLEQPHGVAYQIFDQKGIRMMRQHSETHLATMAEESTIEGLAKRIGIDPKVLSATVQDFNAAINEDRPFDKSKLDGRHTVGLAIPKSNWALAINEAPFRAYPITGGITFTFGGLEVTTNSEVVGTSGNAIRGLYAVGDIVGLFFHNYSNGSGQTRNAVFGYRAGMHAAGMVR